MLEKAGEEGDVDKTQELMTEVETLRARQTLVREEITAEQMKSGAVVGSSVNDVRLYMYSMCVFFFLSFFLFTCFPSLSSLSYSLLLVSMHNRG